MKTGDTIIITYASYLYRTNVNRHNMIGANVGDEGRIIEMKNKKEFLAKINDVIIGFNIDNNKNDNVKFECLQLLRRKKLERILK